MEGDEHTEPDLTTEAHLLPILEELRAREPIFHRPERGTTRAAFEAQMADDFWEIGASGRRYGRAFILATLEARWASPHEDPWETSDFHCRALSPDTYALTYTLKQGARVTRRLTLWRCEEGKQAKDRERAWKIVFHQGTVVDG